MKISGRTHDGWMALIPLSVLLFVVVVAFGGPQTFVNVVVSFANDAVAQAASWVRHL